LSDASILGFSIDPGVQALGVTGCYFVLAGVENRTDDPRFAELRDEELAALRERYAAEKFIERDPVLAGFRTLHTAIGRSNRRFPSAPEALVARFIRTHTLAHINLLVDIYNFVSLKTRLALGAHDVEQIQGNVSLRLVTGTERFVPLGATVPEPVMAGEYSYVDDANDVICRMEVLQVEKTKIEVSSKDAFYIVQGHAAASPELLQSATDELIQLTQAFCGGELRMLYTPTPTIGNPSNG
jgi:DNA/RNA-binding domain of Phe-tRNA-synthetase-like protein